MAQSGLSVFDSTMQKTMKFINEVNEKADIQDEHKAFQALRATLHTLRDRLPVNEAVHFGAQLPRLLAGFYYEGWKNPTEPTKDRSKDAFLSHIREYMQDVDPVLNAEHLARVVFSVLNDKVSKGEIDDIQRALPEELRELWPEEAHKS
jgi:uncharacterized protein (DUF2267 family)